MGEDGEQVEHADGGGEQLAVADQLAATPARHLQHWRGGGLVSPAVAWCPRRCPGVPGAAPPNGCRPVSRLTWLRQLPGGTHCSTQVYSQPTFPARRTSHNPSLVPLCVGHMQTIGSCYMQTVPSLNEERTDVQTQQSAYSYMPGLCNYTIMYLESVVMERKRTLDGFNSEE